MHESFNFAENCWYIAPVYTNNPWHVSRPRHKVLTMKSGISVIAALQGVVCAEQKNTEAAKTRISMGLGASTTTG